VNLSLAAGPGAEVTDAPLGVRVRFPEDAQTQLENIPKSRASIRVAVVNGGHLRTYRKCLPSLVKRVVRLNHADLFLLTYSYLAIQRLNESIVPPTEYVNLTHVLSLARPHLRELYLLDEAKIQQAVRSSFPKHSREFYGLLAKMLSLEVGTRLAAGGTSLLSFTGQPHEFRGSGSSPQTWEADAAVAARSYDVIVRVRPDIYIIGSLSFFRGAESNASVNVLFSCGATEYASSRVEPDAFFRTPHHPTLAWPGDPYSDHALFGNSSAVSRFTFMFSALQARQHDEDFITKYLFYHFSLQNTPERMWSTFASQQGLREILYLGYHILLRDAEQFTLGWSAREGLKNSRLRKALYIFGITNPQDVPCPEPSGRLRQLPSTHGRGSQRRK
jgi:hypothetical protein